MGGLSHMQIVDAITDVAVLVMRQLMVEDTVTKLNPREDIRADVIEVLKAKEDWTLPEAEKLVSWSELLQQTTWANRLVFIALVRAIYN